MNGTPSKKGAEKKIENKKKVAAESAMGGMWGLGNDIIMLSSSGDDDAAAAATRTSISK